MPTFTHVFYGLALLLPILYFARDSFSPKLAFIFLANNIFGPDLVFLFSFIDPGIHNIVGFIVTSIPLALVFSYTSRFTIETTDSHFKYHIRDTHIREINWLNAFCATAAGGISHFFIDQFYHRELDMILFPKFMPNEGRLNIHTMLEWSGEAYHTMNPIMVIGEFLVVAVIVLSPFYFKKGWKETMWVYLIASALALILMLGISPEIFGGEREYAGMFGVTIYFLIPLGLLFYAARDMLDHPRTEPDVPKFPAKTRLTIITVISILTGIILLAYGVVALVMTELIVDLIGGLAVATVPQIRGLAIYYGFFGLLLTVGSIGLLFKNRVFRILTIIGATYFIIFGFPIGISFFLFEDDIRALFGVSVPSSDKKTTD